MPEFEDHQRKSAAPTAARKSVSSTPLSKPPPKDAFDTAYENAAIAALLHAQHWFDKGAASITSKHPIAWQTVCGNAFPSLQQAARGGNQKPTAQHVERMDEMRRAMDIYIELATSRVEVSDAGAFRKVVEHLREQDYIIREMSRLPARPGRQKHVTAMKSDDAYEAQALVACLTSIEVLSNLTHDGIGSMKEGTYAPAIEISSQALEQELAYAVSLLSAYEGSDKARAFAPRIKSVGIALARLQRFIEGRQNNKAMRSQFAGAQKNANKLMVATGLQPIESIELGSSNEVEASEGAELTHITTARSELTSALTTLNTRIHVAADQFYELSKLVDPIDDSSLWSDLVKGLLIALIANVVGPNVGGLITRLAGTKTTKLLEVTEKLVKHPLNFQRTVKQTILKGGEVSNRVGEGAQNLIANTTTDASQAWAGTLTAAEAETKSEKTAQNKAALFFKKSLILAADESRGKIESDVSRRQDDRDISAAEIKAMAAGIEKDAADAFTRTLNGAARDFALMLAQLSLGADAKPNAKPKDKQVTKIGNDYQHGPGWTDGTRLKAEGIARIKIHVTHAGFSVDHYELVGLNKELTKLVYDGAAGRIGHLGVPTEIEFSSDRSGHKDLLVVDELKKIRYVTPWNLFRAPNISELGFASAFATPEKAWQRLQGEVIPNTFTVRTNG